DDCARASAIPPGNRTTAAASLCPGASCTAHGSGCGSPRSTGDTVTGSARASIAAGRPSAELSGGDSLARRARCSIRSAIPAWAPRIGDSTAVSQRARAEDLIASRVDRDAAVHRNPGAENRLVKRVRVPRGDNPQNYRDAVEGHGAIRAVSEEP